MLLFLLAAVLGNFRVLSENTLLRPQVVEVLHGAVPAMCTYKKGPLFLPTGTYEPRTHAGCTPFRTMTKCARTLLCASAVLCARGCALQRGFPHARFSCTADDVARGGVLDSEIDGDAAHRRLAREDALYKCLPKLNRHVNIVTLLSGRFRSIL